MLRLNNRGFTFEQIALIILALLIFMGLLIVFLTQRDKVAESLQGIFGGGQKAVDALNESLKNLGVILIWRLRKQ